MNTIFRNFLSVLRRFKMATALNVLGLSVAFAAFMIIMMQVDYDRSFDRSHPDADRIFRIESGSADNDQWTAILSRPLAEAFIHSSPHIQAGAYSNILRQLTFSVEAHGGKNVFTEDLSEVSTGFVDVFAFDMVEGSEHAIDDPDKALIPLSLARKLFAVEPATGRRLEGIYCTINFGGARADVPHSSYTVGGVYRDFPLNVTATNAVYVSIPATENLNSWNNWNYTTYVRLNDAQSVDGLVDNFKRGFDPSVIPEWGREAYGSPVLRCTPLTALHYLTEVKFDMSPKASRSTTIMLSAITIVILLIAGINYMNFSMAIVPKRIRSINTQKILGGDTGTIRATLVAEAVGIALLSFLIALWIVAAAKDTPLTQLVDADISLSIHPWIIIITGLTAIAMGILAGIYPAWYITSFQPSIVLKGNFGLSSAGRRLRNALISVQFIASFGLIIGTSFMYMQNRFMQRTPLGFDKDRLIVSDINGNVTQNLDAFKSRLNGIASVDAVTCSQVLIAGGDMFTGWGRTYHDESIMYNVLHVEPSFLDFMGIQVSEGRSFRPEDANSDQGVYVFNETARSSFGLKLNESIDDDEIVGFMPDVKFASMRTKVAPMAFFVGTKNTRPPQYVYVRIKAGSDMRAAAADVRSTLKEFDSEYPFDVRFYDEALSQTYAKEQGLATLISVFSLLAILISIVGVFGLVMFESEYRRKEISLRKVFGSTTGEILLMFNKTYLRILTICFLIAAPVAWYAVDRWMENFAYRTPLHWWVFAAAFAVVGALTMGVVTFQSRRAALANPAEAIKRE
jgi:putative ABC transport system permease protein